MSTLLLTTLLSKIACESKKLLLKAMDANADLEVFRLRRMSCTLNWHVNIILIKA